MSDKNKLSNIWTWKDTLNRIQYIDQIISQIVRDGLTINAFLLTVFSALVALKVQPIYLMAAGVVIGVFGLIINITLASNLARQEYIRQWYFGIFPAHLPFIPPSERCLTKTKKKGIRLFLTTAYRTIFWPIITIKSSKDDQNTVQIEDTTYLTDYPIDLEKACKPINNKEKICIMGNDAIGYNESWFGIFRALTTFFIFLIIISVAFFYCW